ncbi:acyl-CoA N-acyltransferase [Apiospora arundinis]|uniref:Acyl-CoA N-acyltransferase n=1 Tax=Apiospora arundinis TaxID=335852 RepID=A0ABR2IW53_9PEZI
MADLADNPLKRLDLEDEDNEGAIDDSEDLDDETAHLQQVKSETRRRQSQVGGNRIQQLLPVPFLPNIRPLTISDLESCVALEDASFSCPEHRCTREKFEYRLKNSAEICMGLFVTVSLEKAKKFEIDTVRTAWPVETGRDAVSVLLAHVVATKCDGDVITDDAMDYPRDFRTVKANATKLGHQESGRTVALHSLAVHPKLQGCGLAKLLMKSYMQQVNNSGTADRISLICQHYLVDFYRKFGFTNLGPSKATFGGGGWHDMAFKLAGPPKK